MKITIEGKEGVDFPDLNGKSRERWEQAMRMTVKESLQLRDVDEIVLKLEYK